MDRPKIFLGHPTCIESRFENVRYSKDVPFFFHTKGDIKTKLYDVKLNKENNVNTFSLLDT